MWGKGGRPRKIKGMIFSDWGWEDGSASKSPCHPAEWLDSDPGACMGKDLTSKHRPEHASPHSHYIIIILGLTASFSSALQEKSS